LPQNTLQGPLHARCPIVLEAILNDLLEGKRAKLEMYFLGGFMTQMQSDFYNNVVVNSRLQNKQK